MYLTSVDSLISNMPELPGSVSWFVMMLTNIERTSQKKDQVLKISYFNYDNRTLDFFVKVQISNMFLW